MTEAPRQTRRLGKVWWAVFAVGFLVLSGIVGFFVLFRFFQIPSASMSPTILKGELLLVRMWRFGPPQTLKRGDLVVFQSPDDPNSLRFSRVVGIPGDRIEIVNKRLRLNGKDVAEPYAKHEDPKVYGSGEGYTALRDNLALTEIPKDRFFVMSDNRDNSFDSRFLGPIPRELLRGGKQVIHLSRP